MSKTRKYCGIDRLPFASNPVNFDNNPFCKDVEPAPLLGDTIQASLLYGADIGAPVSVNYDEDVQDDAQTHDIDILASPNHDFYDIAEQVGHVIEVQAGPVVVDTE